MSKNEMSKIDDRNIRDELVKNDVRCPVCRRWKFTRTPKCSCKGKVKGSDKPSGAAFTPPVKLDEPTNLKRHFDDEGIQKTDRSALKTNKWAEFAPRLTLEKTRRILELLDLLEIKIAQDGTLTFQARPGLSSELLDEIKQLLLDIQSGKELAAFKNYLKDKKGISLEGYDINLTFQDNKLILTIPDKAQRERFIKQLVEKNLLKPVQHKEEQVKEQTKEHSFATPFRTRLLNPQLVR